MGDEVVVLIEENKSSKVIIDIYCCAFKIKNSYFNILQTVVHRPRKISRHVYFFLLTEGGNVFGKVVSTRYKPSPIPAGVLEIPICVA